MGAVYVKTYVSCALVTFSKDLQQEQQAVGTVYT